MTTLSPQLWGLRQTPPLSRFQAAIYCRTGRLIRPDGTPGASKIGRDWQVAEDATVAGGRRAAGNPNWRKSETVK